MLTAKEAVGKSYEEVAQIGLDKTDDIFNEDRYKNLCRYDVEKTVDAMGKNGNGSPSQFPMKCWNLKQRAETDIDGFRQSEIIAAQKLDAERRIKRDETRWEKIARENRESKGRQKGWRDPKIVEKGLGKGVKFPGGKTTHSIYYLEKIPTGTDWKCGEYFHKD